MSTERVIGLLIYCFSALAFLYLLGLWMRSPSPVRRGVYGLVYAVSTVWFLLNAWLTWNPGSLFPLLVLAFAFPPLMLALYRKDGGWLWLNVFCAAAAGVGLASWIGVGPFDAGGVRAAMGVALGVALGAAAAGALRTIAATGAPGQFRSQAWLLATAAVLVPLGVYYSNFWVNLAARSLPTAFLFVGTFYQQRFRFYDIFVKRGLFVLACVAMLGVHRLIFKDQYWTLLPLVVFLPRIFRWIEGWVDRVLLHRRFTTASAARHFLHGLDGAEDEAELNRMAAARLKDIFRAEALVEGGSLQLGARAQNAPVLSEDQALLASLQESYAVVRSNLRLRESRRDQQLATLRARVNPHFLFNALNSIADLTHRDASRAEQTVEQLAEVFRHALKASEREWIPLREELRAVQAYLDVERARFEDRLEVTIDVDPMLESHMVPSMVLQTLVENAVKHGTSKVTDGRLEILCDRARDGTAIRLRVLDNGPGPGASTVRGDDGFGLRAVRERLEHHFGAGAHLELKRQDDGRTLAEVLVPERSAS